MVLPPPRRKGQIEKLSDGYNFQRLKAHDDGLLFVCGWFDLSRVYTRTVRNVDKKIVGMDIVPKVLELSFGNDTIRNTVPTISAYR